MKIIIDIPEELYEANNRGLEAEELWDLRVAVKNGTPLYTVEVIPLEEIDKLHDIVNKIGKNANNKGNLYYAVLEFINKYGTHSTGDYFKFKTESEVKDND